VKQWLIPVGNLLVSERVMKIVKSWDTVVRGAPINYTHTYTRYGTHEKKTYRCPVLFAIALVYVLYYIVIHFFIVSSSCISPTVSYTHALFSRAPRYIIWYIPDEFEWSDPIPSHCTHTVSDGRAVQTALIIRRPFGSPYRTFACL